MKRDEQLVYCRKCIHRKMDFKTGLICSKTGNIAQFENQCNDFILDKNSSNTIIDDSALYKEDLEKKLSPEIFKKLIDAQNLPIGIISSFITGLFCAYLWALITVHLDFQIGLMPIVIGAIIGLVMRYLGKGVEKKFGYWGAGIAVFSCFIGNFFSIAMYAGNLEGLGFIEALILIDYTLVPSIMIDSFSFMDILFYVFALIEGYKFSIRFISDENIDKIKT